MANSLGWADGNELLGNSIPLSAEGLREELSQGVQSLLLASGSFVPILPGLGVSLVAFPDQRLGPAYKGIRHPNGCWIAGTSPNIFLLWTSFSGQCYVHLRSWGSTGGTKSRKQRQQGWDEPLWISYLLRCQMNLCWQWHKLLCSSTRVTVACGRKIWVSQLVLLYGARVEAPCLPCSSSQAL